MRVAHLAVTDKRGDVGVRDRHVIDEKSVSGETTQRGHDAARCRDSDRTRQYLRVG